MVSWDNLLLEVLYKYFLYGSLYVWNRDTWHGARISVFFLDSAPADPSFSVSSAITYWFCYREWNISSYYLNLNSNGTDVYSLPQYVIQEIDPTSSDECAPYPIGNAKCPNYMGCVNGTYPIGGYTCKDFAVDLQTQNVYNLITTYIKILIIGNKLTWFQNIVTTGNLLTGQTTTAEMALYSSIPDEASVMSTMALALNAFLAPINASRISLVYAIGSCSGCASNGSYSIYYKLLQPAQVTVQFTSPGTGLTSAMSTILSLSGLTSSSSNPIVIINSGNNQVTVTYQEDPSTLNTNYFSQAACTFYKNLKNPSKAATLSNLIGSISSITTTDPNCQTTTPSTTTPSTGTTTSTFFIVSVLLGFVWVWGMIGCC